MTTIEVLGPGCRRCTELDKLVREVVTAAHVDAEVRYVTRLRTSTNVRRSQP